jgi:hypothetical protein
VESEDWLRALPRHVADGARRWIGEGTGTTTADAPGAHRHLPAFYLSRFASAQGRVVTLRTEDAAATVGDVATTSRSADFYDALDTTEATRSAAEELLAAADDMAKQPFERLAFGVLFPPQPIDRTKLATWLSLLMVRGPQPRFGADGLASTDAKRDLAGLTSREAVRAYLHGYLREEVGDAEADSVVYLAGHREGWAGHGAGADEVGAILQVARHMEQCFLGRYWTVVRFPEGGLITCDRPLKVFKHPQDRFPDLGVGLATADEIWFPLDRTSAMILHSNKLVGEKVTDSPSTYTVDQFNQEVISSSYQEVYCHEADVERVAGLLPRAEPAVVGASAPTPPAEPRPPRPAPKRGKRNVRAR